MSLTSISDLREWACNDVLPFWSEFGISSANGLAFESLSLSKQPLKDQNLRVRVQFRQIYSFAYTAAMGWFPKGGGVALNLWDRVSQTCRPRDGSRGFVHVLAPDLTVADGTRDSYDHAFAVLALSWLAKASGDAQIINEIETILNFVDEEMSDSRGFLTEGVPARLPRRQNPQMHWFEAMLAMHEAIGHPQGKIRADRHHALFHQTLVDTATHIVGEYFDEDWSIASGEPGQQVEPGHIAEWVWLLRQYERLFGLTADPIPSLMLDCAERFVDPKTNLLPDLASRQGQALQPTARIWLQTERCKAWLAESEAGRPGARDRAVSTLGDLSRRYLAAPFRQGWIDRLSEEGVPIEGPVPTSILYHVLIAVVEADRVLSGS